MEQQPAQMAAAKAELVRRGQERARSGASWTPASLPCMREVVDFKTKEADNMDGIGKSIAFYWVCVRVGLFMDVERSFEEMESESKRVSGAGGKAALELKVLEALREKEENGELAEADAPLLERLAKAEKRNKAKLQKTNKGKANGGGSSSNAQDDKNRSNEEGYFI